MDTNKAFEIVNSIVSGARMNRQEHQIATQALLALKPAEENDLKKEIADDERTD